MAHPLNRPVRRSRTRRVIERLRHPAAARRRQPAELARSRYARLFGGEPGIDPYTRAVSDVYQDLFGEGSFIGKGIYDVDAFEHALDGRFPENRILSHDLLEGCYARAGLAERRAAVRGISRRATAPTSSRRHRWIRGDWQIARWLLPRVPTAGGGRAARIRSRRCRAGRFSTTCAAASCRPRWSRCCCSAGSLLPPLALDARRAGDRARCPCWRVAAASCCASPPTCRCASTSPRRSRTPARHLAQAAFTLACLPYEAFFSLDAIARTAVRMLVTRTRLLRMDDRQRARARAATGLARHALDVDRAGRSPSPRRCWLAALEPGRAGARRAAPAPVARLAGHRLVDQPPARAPRGAADARRRSRSCARSRAGPGRSSRPSSAPDDHWLPPDNFQEHPAAVVAHRTSPTNMGLALLANLTAYDFGYLTAGRAARAHRERARARMQTPGAPPRPLLQLVRHADARSRCRRSTSRRSTAATSPATC